MTPSPIEILIGSENPKVVYLTNTACPASQAFYAGGPLVRPLGGGRFSLCMSSDEGTSWRAMTAPSQLAYAIYGRVIDPQGRFYAQGTPSGSIEEIWRYDPATDVWSKVTQAPLEGDVLAGTSTGANGSTVLWFMSTTGKMVLYRYVI